MDAGDPTRRLLKLLIWALCALGLLLIVIILTGSDLDGPSARAVGTAIALAGSSLAGMAGLRLAQQRPQMGAVGIVTAIVAAGAFLAVTALIWGELEDGADAKVAGISIVLALASGHLSVLLASARSGDAEAVRLLRGAVVVCLGALTLMAILEIAADGDQLEPRLIGVFAVLYVLGSLLLPLARRAAPPEQRSERAPQHSTSGPAPVRLDSVAIGVSDPHRASDFYVNVLGAQPLRLSEGRVAYRIGGQQLEAHAYDPGAEGAIRPGSSSVSLRWEGPFSQALDHLRRIGVEVVAGPQSQLGAQGPCKAVYFRDPDQNLIALVSYE